MLDSAGRDVDDALFDGTIATWQDISGSVTTHNFFATTAGAEPAYDYTDDMVIMNGVSTRIGPTNHQEINTGDVNQRNLSIGVETSGDVVSRQMLWDEGAGARGMNIYIYDNKLFCGFWNMPSMASGHAEDGGQVPTMVSVGIQPNTKYFVTLSLIHI